MKKLLLTAGLAGILVTAAMAQQSRSQTAAVNINVCTFMTLSSFDKSSFNFLITDGGFTSTYNSDGQANFNATSNVPYDLSSVVYGVSPYTVWSIIDSPSVSNTYASTGTSANNGVGYQVGHSVNCEVIGDANNGLTPGSVSGTLRVCITAH
jgi:hypothetical protein